MKRTLVATAGAIVLVCAELLGQVDGDPTAILPVSTERVREALQRQSRLRLPIDLDTSAHFRVDITEDDWKSETALEAVRRELAEDFVVKHPFTVGTTPPLVSVDLLQVAMMVKSRLSAARRARAERNARREVEEALAEFCVAHDCSAPEVGSAASREEGVLTP